MIGTAPSLFPFRFRRVTLSAGLRPALAGAGATPKPQKSNAVLEAFPDVSVISNPVRQLMGKPPETTHFSYWQRRPAACSFANCLKATCVDSLPIAAAACTRKGICVSKRAFSALSSLQRHPAAPFGTKTKTQSPEFVNSFWSCPDFCPRSRRNATGCHLAALDSSRHRKLDATGMTGRQNPSHRAGIQKGPGAVGHPGLC